MKKNRQSCLLDARRLTEAHVVNSSKERLRNVQFVERFHRVQWIVGVFLQNFDLVLSMMQQFVSQNLSHH